METGFTTIKVYDESTVRDIITISNMMGYLEGSESFGFPVYNDDDIFEICLKVIEDCRTNNASGEFSKSRISKCINEFYAEKVKDGEKK